MGRRPSVAGPRTPTPFVNFFDAQDQARKATRWLVIVYAAATILIVAGVTAVVGLVLFQNAASTDPAILTMTAIVTAAFILGATFYKTTVLAAGGGRVAGDLGGTLVPADVQDPLRRRLRNVVEEMAIASGVPVPEIYVLEQEAGINAFAAGYEPGDAAVAVTRGTLELLDRDELQGVIAHEFSHILNGDMRLNIRMMGILFGIMVIGLIGRMALRGGRHTRVSYGGRGKGGSAVLLIGLGLSILGWIGVFFARLIKAAVSRQREFLADASAVQFTRQTGGIAGALKKIGGYSHHSYLRAADPEEVSHMLFAGGLPGFATLFATHPPLSERIRALDPSFRESDYPDVRPGEADRVDEETRASAFAGAAAPAAVRSELIVEQDIVGSVGNPGPEHLDLARGLRATIPEPLYRAAQSPSGAYLLTLALVIDDSHSGHQFQLLERQLGETRVLQIREYHEALKEAGVRYWLPLLEISFPALKQRPAESLEFLLDLLRRLAEVDGVIDLREYCYYRIISRHLDQARAPGGDRGRNRVSKAAARQAAVTLLGIVAEQGNADADSRERAFRAGTRVFGDWAGDATISVEQGSDVSRLDQALDILEKINTSGRRSLVEAVARTVAYDDRMTIREAELLRAVCASLDCPLPPLVSAL